MSEKPLKTIDEIAYSKPLRDALKCFDDKINLINKKHSEFLKSNDIELIKAYELYTSNGGVRYEINNPQVIEVMGSEFKEAFQDCFSGILTIVSNK